jgi:hypothetical protein
MGMVGVWFLWANTMTTVTSLKFHSPRLNLQWWLTFPPETLLEYWQSSGL